MAAFGFHHRLLFPVASLLYFSYFTDLDNLIEGYDGNINLLDSLFHSEQNAYNPLLLTTLENTVPTTTPSVTTNQNSANTNSTKRDRRTGSPMHNPVYSGLSDDTAHDQNAAKRMRNDTNQPNMFVPHGSPNRRATAYNLNTMPTSSGQGVHSNGFPEGIASNNIISSTHLGLAPATTRPQGPGSKRIRY